jgi:hypothetical protein
MTSAPALDSFADNLYAGMEPVAWLDGTVAWSLAHFCAALGVMFQPAEDLARDTPDGPGWSVVVDLARCPDAWLPWLAQFVGVTVIPGSTPAEMRARIASTDGFKRGTPAAIAGAAKATLTGNQYVAFRERDISAPDPPYSLEVITLAGETPDPNATLAAILAQKPAGIVLSYRTVTGQDWQALTAKTWRQARTTYSSWRNLRDNV